MESLVWQKKFKEMCEACLEFPDNFLELHILVVLWLVKLSDELALREYRIVLITIDKNCLDNCGLKTSIFTPAHPYGPISYTSDYSLLNILRSCNF